MASTVRRWQRVCSHQRLCMPTVVNCLGVKFWTLYSLHVHQEDRCCRNQWVAPPTHLYMSIPGGPLSFGDSRKKPSRNSIDSQEGRNGNSRYKDSTVMSTQCLMSMVQIYCFLDRFIFVSNHLPVRCSKSADGNTWEFAWDDDALIAQAKVCILGR